MTNLFRPARGWQWSAIGCPQILAADTATGAGLDVVELAPATIHAVREAVPGAASCDNPIDLGATASPAEIGGALDVLLGAAEVDAVLIVLSRTAVVDMDAVLSRVAATTAGAGKPVVACRVGERADTIPLPGSGHRSAPVRPISTTRPRSISSPEDWLPVAGGWPLRKCTAC